jgi:surface protein
MNPSLFYEYGITRKQFVSTWDTTKISTGSTTATQIKLPLQSTGSYSFSVEWGDGSANLITAWNQAEVTHTYAVAGVYIVKIKGKCKGWSFVNTGDRLKISSVSTWGDLGIAANAFNGCANLVLTEVSDLISFKGSSDDLAGSFANCTSLTFINRVNEWKINNGVINSLWGTFGGSNKFNQDLGNWDVSNITYMYATFANCTVFNNGGNSNINNWNTSKVSDFRQMFLRSGFNQNIGNWNVSNVTNFQYMFHTSLFNNDGSPDIKNWIFKSSGVSLTGLFYGATCFNQNIGSWDVSKVTNMAQMFYNAISFNQPLNNWNTSNVISMSHMFCGGDGVPVFNQNIGSWNVSSVSDFNYMFQDAKAFNNGESSDINNWSIKTTGTVSMANMFARNFPGVMVFNQPLNNWNTSAVITMANMFSGGQGQFNQNIGSWNVSNVSDFSNMFGLSSVFNNGRSPSIGNWSIKTTGTVNMRSMFSNTSVFNQNIGSWNTSAVTNMAAMFAAAKAFNNNGDASIGSWNTSNVTDMASMFSNSSVFNQNIGSWNTSAVTNMAAMFATAKAFNNNGDGSIGSWNTSNVTNMAQMFYINKVFNQNIGNWNTSNVTNMAQMFRESSLNQNIGGWNVSNVTNFSDFMIFKFPTNFSAINLDAIYNGWSSRLVKTPITITFGTAKYTAAGSAGRAILSGAPNNWIITDGGIV